MPNLAGRPNFSLRDFIRDVREAKDLELRFAIAFRAAICASVSHWLLS
jgi:hypothetical protein